MDKELAKKAIKGCICPTCDQHVKIYKRKLTSTMARQLIALYHKTQEWTHTKELVLGGSSSGDFSKLRYWGFIKEKPHAIGDDGKKTSGYWKITPAGRDFVEGELESHSHVMVYNGEPLYTTREGIYIDEALGDKFDYNELMGR